VKQSSRSLEFVWTWHSRYGSQARGIKHGPPVLFTAPSHWYYSNYSVGAAPFLTNILFKFFLSYVLYPVTVCCRWTAVHSRRHHRQRLNTVLNSVSATYFVCVVSRTEWLFDDVFNVNENKLFTCHYGQYKVPRISVAYR